MSTYARLSPVTTTPKDGELISSFVFSIGEKAKRYDFGTKKGANMGRARFMKNLKKDGITVYCQ